MYYVLFLVAWPFLSSILWYSIYKIKSSISFSLMVIACCNGDDHVLSYPSVCQAVCHSSPQLLSSRCSDYFPKRGLLNQQHASGSQVNRHPTHVAPNKQDVAFHSLGQLSPRGLPKLEWVFPYFALCGFQV